MITLLFEFQFVCSFFNEFLFKTSCFSKCVFPFSVFNIKMCKNGANIQNVYFKFNFERIFLQVPYQIFHLYLLIRFDLTFMVSKLKGVKSKSFVTAILHLYIKMFTSYYEVSNNNDIFDLTLLKRLN